MSDTHSTTKLVRVARRLGSIDTSGLTDAELVDLLRAAEELKAAAAACQARAAAALDRSLRGAEAERGVPAQRRGAGVGSQVALAMRTSPVRGRRFVGFAHGLAEMPHVEAALRSGRTTEHRAFLAVRETAHLGLDQRGAVDDALASGPGGIEALGDVAMEHAARSAGDRLDPVAGVERRRRAVGGRHVSLRPAPDGMSRLSAVLPLVDGVSVVAALTQAARVAGDGRSRGAVMADELVARVTGRAPGRCDVELHLVMTDVALLGDDTTATTEQQHETAWATAGNGAAGCWPVPATLARELVRESDQVWVRRLFTAPGSGELVALESSRRTFSGLLRRFLVLRDRSCRTPWCDAPVRHADHVRGAVDGGATSAANGQGLCERCNYAKQAVGLRQHVGDRGEVVSTTSTSHTYVSRAPRPPGAPPGDSAFELYYRDLVLVA